MVFAWDQIVVEFADIYVIIGEDGVVVRVLLVCGVACCVPLMGRSGFPVDLQKRGNGYEMRCFEGRLGCQGVRFIDTMAERG